MNKILKIIFLTTLSLTGLLYSAFISLDQNYLFDLSTSTEDSKSYNIFFIETNEKSEYMNNKQLCSIESNAYHNPEAIVNVLSLKAKINETKLFEKYPNIKWSLLNIKEVFSNTKLEQWWKKDSLTKKNEYYRYSHLSDALRIALIYKYGGFYSDLDHIAIKNFKPLLNYSAIINNKDDNINPESSFFHIKKNHDYLKLAINEYSTNYNGDEWTKNGPELLQRCIIKYCNTTKLNDLLVIDRLNETKINKCDMNILPHFIAYPFEWFDAYKMFEQNGQFEISRLIRTYTIHYNAFVTNKYNINGNDNSIIEFFMAHNCPIVYNNIKKDNLIKIFF